jgi:hypothetical protein
MIIADISFYGQLVAEQLGVPSVCIATFDWSFIYQFYRGHNPDLDSVLTKLEAICSRFDYCLVPGAICEPLKIGGERHSFHWCSRKPTISRTAMRERLKLTLYTDSVLLSFGGHALRQLPDTVWRRFEQYEFFIIVPQADAWTATAPNVHILPSEIWSRLHVDLVNTVDIVIGKLGYGLVAEVLHCRAKFVAVDRPGNPECAVLKKAVARVCPYRELTYEQFRDGDWYVINDLIEVQRNSLDFEECETDGDVQIATWIRNKLGDKEPFYWDPRTLLKWHYFVIVIAILWYFLWKR